MVLAARGACAWLDCLQAAWTFCPIYKDKDSSSGSNMSAGKNALGLRWAEIGLVGRNLQSLWFV